jgi:hypothetical protein
MRTMGDRVLVVIRSMADYNTMLYFLIDYTFHRFKFCPITDMPVNAAAYHLPTKISLQ